MIDEVASHAEHGSRLHHLLSRWLTVPADELEGLAGYLCPCRFSAGDFLFNDVGIVNELIFLESGVVRVFYLLDDKEVNLRLLTAPSAALPYNSFLLKQAPDETVQALTAVTGLRVRFRDFCRENPGLLSERLQRLLAETHFLALQRRLRMLQNRNARERYLYFLKVMEPEIVRKTSGYHIASYLGITPESLSRARKPQIEFDKNQ